MCKDVEGSCSDCAFKIHKLKCPKGHPLHLSSGRTFLCCRSGCMYIEFVTKENITKVEKQIRGRGIK